MYGEEFDVECLRNFEEKYSPSSTFIGIRSPAEDYAHYSKTREYLTDYLNCLISR